MRQLLVAATLSWLVGATAPTSAREIAVAADADALGSAIAAAAPGDILRLGAAEYRAPIVIDKPLSLLGVDGTRIVGTGQGTVIRILASDVTIEGVTVSGSGARLDALDAGIAIDKTASRARIVGDVIVGNLIGIDVQGGPDALLDHNTISGRTDLHMSDRGAGIYVWNAPGLVAQNNVITAGRDGIFVTTSRADVFRNNHMSGVRFAFHSMYGNDVEVTGNVSIGDDLGFAFMYSRGVIAKNNVTQGDRTHGLLLNDVTGAEIVHNGVEAAGQECLFVYNVNDAHIQGNRLADCDIGIHFTGGSDHITLTGNAFIGNHTQVKYVGARWFEWSENGHGNYWSDHVAFDINGDGVADSPYRPSDSVDELTWSQPMAKLLLGSPAVQLIRWAQSRFPGLLPGGVVDNYPLMDSSGAGPTASAASDPATTE